MLTNGGCWESSYCETNAEMSFVLRIRFITQNTNTNLHEEDAALLYVISNNIVYKYIIKYMHEL